MYAEIALRKLASKLGSTFGKICAPVPSTPALVRIAPEALYPEGLVCMKSYALPNESRVFVIKRIFGPNWKTWFPFVQVTSSAKLCTGVRRLDVRVGAKVKMFRKLI